MVFIISTLSKIRKIKKTLVHAGTVARTLLRARQRPRKDDPEDANPILRKYPLLIFAAINRLVATQKIRRAWIPRPALGTVFNRGDGTQPRTAHCHHLLGVRKD